MDEPRLLVGDNQRLFADALASALHTEGPFEVLPDRPRTGAEVARAVRGPRPDIALLGYWLQDIRGAGLVHTVLGNNPECSVVLMSGLLSPDQIRDALTAGAVGFLPTSIPLVTLLEGLEEVRAGRTPIFEGELAGLVDTLERRGDYLEETARRLEQLTPRELEVLRLIGAGLSATEVADRLGNAEGTVRRHIHHILSKTDTQSQLEAVAVARDHGVVP